MIRVLVVHDTCLLRSALAALLGRESDLEVAATSWKGLGGVARSLLPHVCVVDVDCPGSARLATDAGLAELSGVSSAAPRASIPERRSLPARSPALLVLAAASKPGLLRRASQARALGFVNKDASPDGLTRAIRRVAEGERFIDTSLGFDFLRAAEIPLTRRELSVLSLAAEGASVAEIASSLHLSNGTVRNYMASIKRKTGARNRVDAIRISRGAGWL